MTLIQEVEKVIAELPPRKAGDLKFWLEELKAARRYKYVKAYTKATKTLADFEKNNGDASLN